MVVTEEWAYIWGLKEWLWNLRQIALFFQTSLILKMEMIIPNNRVSVSIAVLSTLNMARDSPMVLTVVSLSSYSCNVQERTHFSLKCFFLFPFFPLWKSQLCLSRLVSYSPVFCWWGVVWCIPLSGRQAIWALLLLSDFQMVTSLSRVNAGSNCFLAIILASAQMERCSLNSQWPSSEVLRDEGNSTHLGNVNFTLDGATTLWVLYWRKCTSFLYC